MARRTMKNPALWDDPVYKWWAAAWPGNLSIKQPRLGVLHYALGKTASTEDADCAMSLVVTRDTMPSEADLQAIERTIRRS